MLEEAGKNVSLKSLTLIGILTDALSVHDASFSLSENEKKSISTFWFASVLQSKVVLPVHLSV